MKAVIFLAEYSLTWVKLEDACLALVGPLISVNSVYQSAASSLVCGLLSSLLPCIPEMG